MQDFSELAKLGPTVAVVGMFLLYLLKKQKEDDKIRANVDEIIQKHIKENTKAMDSFAEKIRDLSSIIEKMESRLAESAQIIKQLYEENYKKYKKIKKLEERDV